MKWFFFLLEDVYRFIFERCWVEDFPFFETDKYLFSLDDIKKYIHDGIENSIGEITELSKESEMNSIIENCGLHDITFFFEELESFFVYSFYHFLGYFGKVEVCISSELRFGSLQIVVCLEENIYDIMIDGSLDTYICNDS
jgi:hypothetical protein